MTADRPLTAGRRWVARSSPGAIERPMLPHQPQVCARKSVRAIPRVWLMTDARLGAEIAAIVARLPPRSAVVIRPYALAGTGRAALMRAIRRVASAKRHLLLMAGDSPIKGTHGRHAGRAKRRTTGRPPFSMPVHTARDARQACRIGVRAAVISPVWPTASHPGAAQLGLRRFAQLARQCRCPAIALGGMTETRFRQARAHGAHGWAAIGAWKLKTEDQKRKRVPT